jgi:uncharacterized protein (TIGR03086 family)
VTDRLLTSLDTALDGAGHLVGAVAAEQWELPTPCSDWTVRQLVNHLVGGNRLFARVLRGEALPPPEQLGRRGSQDQLGDDPAAAFAGSADELRAALRGPEVLAGTYTVPAGTLPGPALVQLRTVEMLVHGWDLARATGQEYAADPRLLESLIEFLSQGPSEGTPGMFGPVHPSDDEADLLDQAVALAGRDPRWRPLTSAH